MTLEDLRELAARLPTESSVTLPRDALLEAVGEPSRLQPSIGLTVAELAARFHRASSTVRGWVEAGRFPEAFKLEGRDWRVPESSVDAFLETQRHGWATSARLVTGEMCGGSCHAEKLGEDAI